MCSQCTYPDDYEEKQRIKAEKQAQKDAAKAEAVEDSKPKQGKRKKTGPSSEGEKEECGAIGTRSLIHSMWRRRMYHFKGPLQGDVPYE